MVYLISYVLILICSVSHFWPNMVYLVSISQLLKIYSTIVAGTNGILKSSGPQSEFLCNLLVV